MSILIENAEETEYLTASGQWSKKPGDGSSFASTRAAFAAAKNEPIGKFNIVQFFALSGQLINLDRGSGKGKEARPVQSKDPAKASTAEISAPGPADAGTP